MPLSLPLAERVHAREEGRAVARVWATADVPGVVQALHAVGHGQPAEPKERRHHILRVDGRRQPLRAPSGQPGVPQQKGNVDRFFPGPLLLHLPLRPEHIPVVGREHEDRVVLHTGLTDRPQQISDAGIQSRAVRIVPGQPLPRLRGHVLRHVGPQHDAIRIVQRPVLIRRSLVRGVRRAPGQHQQERIPLAVVSDIGLGILRLCDRIVPVPDDLLIRIPIIVGRLIVIVRTLQHLPGVESQASLRRNGVGPPVSVHVPLPDVGRIVPRTRERLSDTR